MLKIRDDLLISPGHPISSQDGWWAACSKAHINIVAIEDTIFMHWHQECGLLGSDKIARVGQQGYSLQSHHHDRTARICAFHTGTGRWNIMSLTTSPALRHPLSSLQPLPISDSHEYSASTNAERCMPLWSYMSLTREPSGRNGNTVVWSQYNDSSSSAIHCTHKKYNNPKGPQSQNWINEYLGIPDAKNTPEISFSS